MVNEERLVLFDRIVLPISVITTTATRCVNTQTTIEQDSAKLLANDELSKMISNCDLEVLSISKQYQCDGSALKMIYSIYCIENIAIEIPMSGVPIDPKE